jgi:AGZA family xanthine/uracil permease-like MFS transporter
MFAVIAWVVVKVFTGKVKDIKPVMWIIFVLFALRILALVTNFM